jgi:Bacterial self-protective colicin-like immunity
MIREKYVNLIQDFLDRRMLVEDFEQKFLKEFKSETVSSDFELSSILDRLFCSVDCYWAGCDEGEESAFEISESKLRKDAAIALKALLLV